MRPVTIVIALMLMAILGDFAGATTGHAAHEHGVQAPEAPTFSLVGDQVQSASDPVQLCSSEEQSGHRHGGHHHHDEPAECCSFMCSSSAVALPPTLTFGGLTLRGRAAAKPVHFAWQREISPPRRPPRALAV